MPRAILFDLDGVIVDTENTVWYDSSVRLLASYNMHHEEEKLKPV